MDDSGGPLRWLGPLLLVVVGALYAWSRSTRSISPLSDLPLWLVLLIGASIGLGAWVIGPHVPNLRRRSPRDE